MYHVLGHTRAGGVRVSDFNMLPNPLTLALSPFQGARGLNQRFPNMHI